MNKSLSSDSINWLHVSLILLFAAVFRWILFNGPMGSDDIVYIARALQIANGIWTPSDYNGAIRYGFNIPAGFFIYLFGISEASANLWPFLCSLGEIIIVYLIALRIFGTKVAIFSAIILSTLPIHVAASTRIHVDSVASFFITLSFVLFFFANKNNSKVLFFLSGLATGFVFWCRELVILYILAFFFYPLIFRQFTRCFIYFIIGGLIMLLLHLALMWVIADNPFHVFTSVLAQIDKDFIHGEKDDSPMYYFYYLFAKPVHTWLLGLTAMFGIVSVLKNRGWQTDSLYIIYWALSLLIIFSFTPISFDPFRFVTKQSNYLIMYVAPLTILAGYWFSKLSFHSMLVAAAVILIGNLLLSSLEQQVIRVFVANGQALVDYVEANPEIQVYGSVNNANIAQALKLTEGKTDVASRISTLNQLQQSVDSTKRQLAFIDRETLNWSANDRRINKVPPCWQLEKELRPTGFGLGHTLMGVLLAVTKALTLPDSVINALQRYYEPLPGQLYRFPPNDPWCKAFIPARLPTTIER